MEKKHIYVISMDEHNRRELNAVLNPKLYEYHSVFDHSVIKNNEKLDIVELVENAEKELRKSEYPIDGIIGFWDFPISLVAPYLSAQFGLPGPSIESVLRAEHKYWSRHAQQQSIPEMVPEFHPVNVNSPQDYKNIPLSLPFWIKPCIAHSSQMAMEIHSEDEYIQAVQGMKERLGKFGEPYNRFLDLVKAEGDLREIDGCWAIAEKPIATGEQCTLSGFIYNDDITIYGLVDSINYEQAPSFFRYEYPSQLPYAAFKRMEDAAIKVITQLGLNNTAFNIEFFVDWEENRIWLLEINTRISQSHTHLYSQVDGESNHQIIIDISTGIPPRIKKGNGPFKVAAKIHLRKFEDGYIEEVPSEKECKEVAQNYPGTDLVPEIEKGKNLSDYPDQDAYSYLLGALYTAANSRNELLQKYRQICDSVNFRFSEPK
ncbi:MAG: acetyl-CoA carboxylase biotin carboxylase subunit family protein [Spirochaetia bacterium]